MRPLARSSYRLLLRLHPHSFRIEFGQEMLWIFDEQMKSGSQGKVPGLICTRLLLDASRSAFVQRTLREVPPQRGYLSIASSSPLLQIAEGGFILASCSFNLLGIVGVLAALLCSR